MIQLQGPCTVHYFNPRSREGSDGGNGVLDALYEISIHAPAKGATSVVVPHDIKPNRFQSTLPRRERLRNSTQFATKTYRKYQIEILFFS